MRPKRNPRDIYINRCARALNDYAAIGQMDNNFFIGYSWDLINACRKRIIEKLYPNGFLTDVQRKNKEIKIKQYYLRMAEKLEQGAETQKEVWYRYSKNPKIKEVEPVGFGDIIGMIYQVAPPLGTTLRGIIRKNILRKHHIIFD